MAPDARIASALLILISVGIIFFSLMLLVKVLRELTATRMQVFVSRSLHANAYVGLLIGAAVTVMVQSSSITTSVLVPLAGAGLVTLEHVFPITLGANLGTTVTALLASMAAPTETAGQAMQIASVHLLFNAVGIAMIYPFNFTRQIPLRAASKLAEVAVRSKQTAVFYVLFLFYGLPGLLVGLSRL